MAKRPAKSTPRAALQPAQLKAIERLLERHDYTAAATRLKALIASFPAHGGLRGLLVVALEQGGESQQAALAALQWAELKPDSLPAQEALLHFAVAGRLLLLADRTAARIRALGGTTRGFPLPAALLEEMLSYFGEQTDPDELLRFERGQFYLRANDFAGTVARLEGLSLSSARNNYALALFHLDRPEAARDAFAATRAAHPQNLFALAWEARLCLYLGDEAAAAALCTPLEATLPPRLDDAIQQLETLLLLGRDQAAWGLFERARRCDWFEGEIAAGGDSATLRHYGAAAAARLGREKEARRWWEAALRIAALPPAQENLDRLRRDPAGARWPAIFQPHHALPVATLDALREGRFDRIVATLTVSDRYLAAHFRAGDQASRAVMETLLRYRAERGDREATNRLLELVRLPLGSREQRFGILSALRRHGAIDAGEPVELWDDGELRRVEVIGTEITREPLESGLSERPKRLLAEALACLDSGPARAEALLKRLLEEHPDHPILLGNLAAAYAGQGRREEAKALLQQLVERNPDYLFGRCNLARMLLAEGGIEAAERLLEGLERRDRLHVQEAFSLYGTLAMLYQAKGDGEAAAILLARLAALVEDEGDERRLADIRAAVEEWKHRHGTFRSALDKLLARRGKGRA